MRNVFQSHVASQLGMASISGLELKILCFLQSIAGVSYIMAH